MKNYIEIRINRNKWSEYLQAYFKADPDMLVCYFYDNAFDVASYKDINVSIKELVELVINSEDFEKAIKRELEERDTMEWVVDGIEFEKIFKKHPEYKNIVKRLKNKVAEYNKEPKVKYNNKQKTKIEEATNFLQLNGYVVQRFEF